MNDKRFFTYIQDPPTLPQHYYKPPKMKRMPYSGQQKMNPSPYPQGD